MTKKRKRRRDKRPQRRVTPSASILATAGDPTAVSKELSLRQGGANVAGVRYQLAVTAWLLTRQPTGFAISEVVPEGLEDIDVRPMAEQRHGSLGRTARAAASAAARSSSVSGIR